MLWAATVFNYSKREFCSLNFIKVKTSEAFKNVRSHKKGFGRKTSLSSNPGSCRKIRARVVR